MKTLRVALVGAGYMGSLHAQKIVACKGVELAAVVDPEARGAELAKKHGAAFHPKLDGALEDIDAAIVAAPTERHHALVTACLEAGAHVLVEKPIAVTLKEADALVALAKKKKRVLQVGHVERYNATFRALAGRIEKPLYIETERLAGFKQRGADVDVILDLMIHDIDLALALAVSEVKAVSACGFRVLTRDIDIANARLEFASGAVANLSASRVSQQPVRKLRVFQPGRYASADLQAGALRYVSEAGGAIEEKVDDKGRSDGLAVQAQAFVAAIRGEAAPPVSGADGRRALEIAITVGRLIAERLTRFGGK